MRCEFNPESEVVDIFLKNILKDADFINWINGKRYNKRVHLSLIEIPEGVVLVDKGIYKVYTCVAKGVLDMFTTINRWGNSQAVRLPKRALEIASLNENDRVEILAEQDCIIIRRTNKNHRTIEDRFNGYSGDYVCTEADTGTTVGKEV